jgi:hypothetical protein
MVEAIYKELAIETDDMMEKVLRPLLFGCEAVTVSDCICCT